MSDISRSPVLRYLDRLVARSNIIQATDRQLLERFLDHRDETAFAALVGRHGPMVLGVCRRILRDADDSEDAFQATFLVLVRRAAAIGKREALGSWLYKVAYRTALRAKYAAMKRRVKEQAAAGLQSPEAEHDQIWWELRPLLDEELARLPEKYRTSLIACYFEGRTKEEAAQELGCPAGTISSRPARGRDLLRARLVKRGVAISAAGLASALASGPATASTTLVTLTVNAALLAAAGQLTAVGAISAQVTALTEGMVRAMFWAKMRVILAVFLMVGVAGLSTSWSAVQAVGQETAKQPDNEKPKAAKPQENKSSDAEDGKLEVAITRDVIHPYTPLGMDSFTFRQMPAKLAEGWLTKQDVQNIIAEKRMLRLQVTKSKPLTTADLYDAARDSLRGLLNPGEVAMTINVDPMPNALGFVMPDSRVDVEATGVQKTPDGVKIASQIILQNVEVLATNEQLDPNGPKKPANRVTLRLTREQALLLGSYKEGTILRLLLRAKEDVSKNDPTADPKYQLLQDLLRTKRSNEQIVEALYLAIHGRLPSDREMTAATKRIGESKIEREKAFAELLQTLTTHTSK